jgi:bifunctional DNA primase/polymerase-like protein
VITSVSKDYMRRGWSIIPIRLGDKRPFVRWEQFQHRRADEAETCDWFRTCPEAGIGIVTGTVSGLVVLDVDVRHGGDAAVLRQNLVQLTQEPSDVYRSGHRSRPGRSLRAG